ncbi:MAG: S8 family serine peptidase [bacterium]
MEAGFHKRVRIQFGVAVVVLLLLLLTVSLSAGVDFSPNRLIVRFQQEPTALGSYQAQCPGLESVTPLFPPARQTALAVRFPAPAYVFTFSDEALLLAAQSRLASDPAVRYAERDPLMQLFSDSLFSQQWGLRNEGQTYLGIERISGINNDTVALKNGIPGADIGWPDEALDEPRHRPILAITDTGVDYLHPDLWANIWHNPQEVPDNGLDDDFNGLVDDVYGYDFSGDSTLLTGIVGDSDPIDFHGHGTHVSGIAAAMADNDIGIRGVAPGAQIMCLKIFPNAFASVSSQAIIYAVENGARAINASWGGPYYSSILHEAVQFAQSQGVIFVAAAGNSGDNSRLFPAGFDESLTVGATNSLDEITFFSSYGSWLDIAAPGRDILSLRAAGTDMYAGSGEPGVRIVADQYMLSDGTSMAAPHVTGAIGLLLSLSPGLRGDSVQTLLEVSAKDLTDPNGDGGYFPGKDYYSGMGRLDVGRALGLTSGDYVELESPVHGSYYSGSVAVVGSAMSTAGADFELLVRPQSTGEWIVLASGPATRVRDTLAVWQSDEYDGSTEFALRLGDGLEFLATTFLANSAQVEITFPAEGDTVISASDIIGSASHPEFERFVLSYVSDDPPGKVYPVASSTRLRYAERLHDWKLGPIPPGSGKLRLEVFAAGEVLSAETPIQISSLLTENFPVSPVSRPGLFLTAGNLDDDPAAELVCGSDSGIVIVDVETAAVTEWRPAFGRYFLSAVSLYDFDGDGIDEVVAVSDSGVAVLYHDGSFAPGWPKFLVTGNLYNALSTALIEDINGDGEMEILMVNRSGEIYCWHFDGSPYFHSTNGLFSRLVDREVFSLFGGAYVPFLFAYDFNRDGYRDVGALYPVSSASGGLFMLSGRTGQPLYREKGKQVRQADDLFGGVLADFDGDGMPEIGFSHWFGAGRSLMAVSVVEADGTMLDGWPKVFYDKTQWLAAYPAAADLDGDSLPELICTFSALDGGEVRVWHGDGSAWLVNEFGPNDGLLATSETSLGPSLVVDLDDDGELEILCRGGALFWGKYERIHAWNLDGTPARHWPNYTYADPATVTYAPFVPAVGDFDLDGKLELAMASSARSIYCWDLPTPTSAAAVVWGSFLHDSRHTGLLPILRRPVVPVDLPILPTRLHISQNYPNPFNGETSIEIYLPAAAQVQVDVYNILGQRVANLADQYLPAGVHRFDWNGRDSHGQAVASGVYFFMLSDGDTKLTRKSLYLK